MFENQIYSVRLVHFNTPLKPRRMHGRILLEGVPQLACLTRHLRTKQMVDKYHDVDKGMIGTRDGESLRGN
jgi:hypothetical protein